MRELEITCNGFQIGKIAIPNFEVRKGQLSCFHWPLPRGSLEETHFWRILLGTETEISLQVFGKVTKINLPCEKKGIFSYFFYRETIEKLLMESGNIDAKQVSNILKKLSIVPHSFISSISLTTRILLGIEMAWGNSPDVVLFETSGLDPLGIETICQAILGKLDTCAAIHFSYPTTPTRTCCSQSQCLEIKQTSKRIVRHPAK